MTEEIKKSKEDLHPFSLSEEIMISICETIPKDIKIGDVFKIVRENQIRAMKATTS